MLDELRHIVQELSGLKDLQEVLDTIAARVRTAMGTDVCSVYLLDQESESLLFAATEGLNKDIIGSLSISINEGLVGEVARRKEPVNLEDAESSPNFLYLKELNEELFKAFLGVPIIHQRHVLGVLVVQQQQKRRFDESDEAFLVTMSAQLAGVIAHAKASGIINMSAHNHCNKVGYTRFEGVAGAVGIGIGQTVVVRPPADLKSVPMRSCDDVEAELIFFHHCLVMVREDIQKLSRRLDDRLAKEEQALFDVYLSMLDDRALATEVDELIKQGHWAQWALSEVILSHVKTFELMDDDYLKERASDVVDLGRRVLARLQESDEINIDYPDKTILIGEDLTASILGEVPQEKLAGLVSASGSRNSHLAILARSMGIPTVMGAVDIPFNELDDSQVIVDGYNGNVFVSPPYELLTRYQAIYQEELELGRELEAIKDLPSVTKDGFPVSLWVNTGLMADVMRSLDRGAEGVGLYRTEVPFLMKDRFPTEEEQRVIYRRQLEAFSPRKVTMRTLDIGGDKSLSYFPIVEDNPFLGWRGIRVTLDHPEIFRVQLRAMIKANIDLGNLRIMLPMVTNMPELDEAIDLIMQVHRELIVEMDCAIPKPEIGVMVEVPAAVYQAREFARKVDFLSVGSNDLTQYLLAVDRNNPAVADIYDSFHPAVLKALQDIVEAAHAERKKVGICGELAGDPAAAVILVAMGYDVLSMNSTNLLKVKAVLREVTMEQAKLWLSEISQMSSPVKIRNYMQQALIDLGIERLLMPGANTMKTQ